MSHDVNPPDEPKARSFGAFYSRDFRLLWIGQVISHLGGWMQITAQSWLVYQMTGSALQVGLTGFVRTIPFIFITLYAGTVVDRVDRRKLLITIEGLNGLLMLFLAILVAGDWVELWHIYAVSAGIGAVAAFEAPARSSLIPYLVPREDLMTAIGLNSSVRKGSQVIGPALGGLFVASFGVAGAFFIHSAAYVVLLACLALMRTTNPIDDRPARSPLQSMMEGVRYVTTDSSLTTLLIMQSIVSLFGSTQPMMVVFAKDIFNTGPEGLGFLQSAVGVGAILGSIVLAARGDVHNKGRLIFVSGLLFSGSMLAFAAAPTFLIAVPILIFSGFVDIMFGTTKQTVIQLLVNRSFLGRVMSLNSISQRGLGQGAGFQSGALTSIIGVQWATAIGGLVCLGALFTARVASPKVWQFTGSGLWGDGQAGGRGRRGGGGQPDEAASVAAGLHID